MKDLLSTAALDLGYHPAAVLARDLNLRFTAGELVCLAGPNGSGKSTLLRTLAGLLDPLAGQVQLGGGPLLRLGANERARRLAVVFSRFPSGTHLNGYEYVALGRSPYTGWLDRLSATDTAKIDEALRLADATHLAHLPVDDLSDGERQRLSVARALAQEAQVLLLDEPTAFLDLPHRVNLYRMLRTLARSRELCVIMSSHELDLALRFADRMVLLDGKGQVDVGIPEALALGGAIAKAFATPEVRFDLESGSFVMNDTVCSPICCMGDSLEAQWTRRALHRMGYELVGSGWPLVRVEHAEGRCCWIVSLTEGQECFVYNIEAAMALLPR